MASFPFELVSPARLVFTGEVEQVDVPGAEGYFGVLPNHAPFISTLRPGILTVRNGADVQRYFVRDGFAEVDPSGLTVLAETAVAIAEMDVNLILDEIKALEKAIGEAKEEAARWKHTELLEHLKAAASQFAQPQATAAH